MDNRTHTTNVDTHMTPVPKQKTVQMNLEVCRNCGNTNSMAVNSFNFHLTVINGILFPV